MIRSLFCSYEKRLCPPLGVAFDQFSFFKLCNFIFQSKCLFSLSFEVFGFRGCLILFPLLLSSGSSNTFLFLIFIVGARSIHVNNNGRTNCRKKLYYIRYQPEMIANKEMFFVSRKLSSAIPFRVSISYFSTPSLTAQSDWIWCLITGLHAWLSLYFPLQIISEPWCTMGSVPNSSGHARNCAPMAFTTGSPQGSLTN